MGVLEMAILLAIDTLMMVVVAITMHRWRYWQLEGGPWL